MFLTICKFFIPQLVIYQHPFPIPYPAESGHMGTCPLFYKYIFNRKSQVSAIRKSMYLILRRGFFFKSGCFLQRKHACTLISVLP